MSPRPSQPPGPSALATRFVLHTPLSTSATATILAALDRRLERPVVVTLFRPEHAHSEEERRRLVRVAMKVAAIDHPHLMPIIEVGVSSEGQVFLVTPRAEGRTLRELAGDEPMEWRRAVEFARQLLTAIMALHERGVVHGDVSPERCLVTTDGGREHLRLCDFGPLIASGRRGVDAGADVRAVGVLLHHLVFGGLPVEGAPLEEFREQVLASERTAVRSVPEDIIALLRRATATPPADRFTSARDLAAALTEASSAGDRGRATGDRSAGASAARAALAAWTRFEYALARREARRASALDPAWLPLHLLMSCLPEADPERDRP